MRRAPKAYFLSYPENCDGAPHHRMALRFLAAKGLDIVPIDTGGRTFVERISNFLRALVFAYARNISGEASLIYIESAPQTVLLFFLRFLKCSIVYQTQDYLEPRQNIRYNIFRFFERSAARRANLVVSNEINRARFIAFDYGLAEIPIVVRTALPRDWPVPECANSDRAILRKKFGLPVDRKLIAAGGGISDDRMSFQLVGAIKYLPKDFAVVFTGHAQSDFRDTEFQKLVDDSRIFFVERMPYKELLRLYSVCDIGVLLYPHNSIGHFYQCPGRLTEYMRCGLPVVFSKFPGFELLCLKYKIGQCCDATESKSIADACIAVSDCSVFEPERIKHVAKNELAYEEGARDLWDSVSRMLNRNAV